MDDNERAIEEAIRLELNMRDLYSLYAVLFPEDKVFWQKISKEEEGHALIIEKCKSIPDYFPEDFVFPDAGILTIENKKVQDAIVSYRSSRPDRDEAYKFALSMERDAAEAHYQSFTVKTDNVDLFKKLNSDDKDHAERIAGLLDKK